MWKLNFSNKHVCKRLVFPYQVHFWFDGTFKLCSRLVCFCKQWFNILSCCSEWCRRIYFHFWSYFPLVLINFRSCVWYISVEWEKILGKEGRAEPAAATWRHKSQELFYPSAKGKHTINFMPNEICQLILVDVEYPAIRSSLFSRPSKIRR